MAPDVWNHPTFARPTDWSTKLPIHTHRNGHSFVNREANGVSRRNAIELQFQDHIEHLQEICQMSCPFSVVCWIRAEITHETILPGQGKANEFPSPVVAKAFVPSSNNLTESILKMLHTMHAGDRNCKMLGYVWECSDSTGLWVIISPNGTLTQETAFDWRSSHPNIDRVSYQRYTESGWWSLTRLAADQNFLFSERDCNQPVVCLTSSILPVPLPNSPA